MKVKLSKIQLEVLQLMNSGWELGLDIYLGRCWMQLGGIGYGGESKAITRPTYYKMLKLKLIEINLDMFPTITYRLTEKGIQCIKDKGVLFNEPKQIKSKRLKVFGGCLDGKNRTIVACKSLKQFSVIAGTSYNYCREYCCKTGNEKEINIALKYPFRAILLDNITKEVLEIGK